MGTPIEEFDQWLFAEELPPRLDPIPSHLVDILQDHRDIAETQIRYFQNNFCKGTTLDFHYNYVDSGELNAVAGIYNRLGMVAIYRGAVLLPRDMFQRMLAHPLVLTTIGNSANESIAGQFSEGLFSDIDELEKLRISKGRSPYPVAPNEPIRQEFSAACHQFAFDFLALHELAHIILGTCDYLGIASGHSVILEAAAGLTPDFSDKLTRQTIEMICDAYAVGTTMGHLLRDDLPVPPTWNSFFSTIEQKLFMWCFSVAGLFRLWGVKIDLATIHEKTHPPTAMRFMMAYMKAHQLVEAIRPELKINFRNIASQAQFLLNGAVSLIGGPKLTGDDIDPVYSPAGLAHYNKLREHWSKVIFPDLKDFSYVPFP